MRGIDFHSTTIFYFQNSILIMYEVHLHLPWDQKKKIAND